MDKMLILLPEEEKPGFFFQGSQLTSGLTYSLSQSVILKEWLCKQTSYGLFVESLALFMLSLMRLSRP